MDVAVIGLGYVGCTNAACFSAYGHRIYGFDLDQEKVAALRGGRAPFYEPKINELLSDGAQSGLITAHLSFKGMLGAMDVALVCVGASNADDGSIELSTVQACARQIADEITTRDPARPPLMVVFRTTMAPGSMETTLLPIFETVIGEPAGVRYELAFYPEFLREGAAVSDFFNPPRIVLGERFEGASKMLGGLLNALRETSQSPVFLTDFRTAEMVKFTDNTWHALKVAFANEIARIAMANGADPAKTAEIFCADTVLNISTKYLKPGAAFGGSCLPKDVRAMTALARGRSVAAPLVTSVMTSNEDHKLFLAQQVAQACAGARRILQIGLSFKGDTDDLRDSPQIDLWSALVDRGFEVCVYDPDVTPSRLTNAARDVIPAKARGVLDALFVDIDEALDWADKVVVAKTIKPIEGKLAKRDVVRVDALSRALQARPVVAAE